jgi:hypothetical protein
MIKQTVEEWRNEAISLFGENPRNWKFKCPACGHVSSVQDFLDLEVDPQGAYVVCIGRVNGKGADGLKGKDEGYGCNWAAYGLFGTLGKGRKVIVEDGREVEVFDFAIESIEKEAI